MPGEKERRLPSTLLVTAVVMVSGLTASTGAWAQTRTVALQDAIADGTVRAVFVGTGASSGDSVRMRVAKSSRAPLGTLEVTIAPGSILRTTGGSYQSMVVTGVRGVETGPGMYLPTSRIRLTGPQVVAYILSAFCAEFEKDNPSESDTFALADADSSLSCIARKGATLTVEGLQAAIWMYTDRLSYSTMREKLPVSSQDWSSAERVFRACAR